MEQGISRDLCNYFPAPCSLHPAHLRILSDEALRSREEVGGVYE